jgi:chromosome segregation ATPase
LEDKVLEAEQQARISNRALDSEKQECELLKEQVASLKRLADEERDTYKDRMNQANKKLAEATGTVSELERQLKAEKKDQSLTLVKIDSLERQVTSLTRQIEDLTQEFQITKGTLKGQNDKLGHSIDQMKEQIDTLERDKASLERKLKNSSTEISNLEADLELARKKTKPIENRDKEDALDQANIEIARLKKIVKHKEGEIEELVNNMTKQAKRPDAAESDQFEEIIRLKNRIKILEEELNSVNSKPSGLSKSDIQRFQEQIEDLTEDKNQLLQKLKDKQTQMLKAIQDKDDEIEQLQVSFQEKNSSLS